MQTKLKGLRSFLLCAVVSLFLWIPGLSAKDKSKPASGSEMKNQECPAACKAAFQFSSAADKALQAMVKRAEELKIHGVAVVAYVEGENRKGWSSKMAVVGSMTNPPSAGKPGDNLLAIAYTKASEMAETLKDSGNAGRPPLTGEFGRTGGVIAKSKTGYVIAAFSGGPSEDDVKASQAGLEVLVGGL